MAIERTPDEERAFRTEQIRIMLAKAENEATTTEEAEMITGQVERLMLKYGIESLAAKERTQETIVRRYVEFSGVYSKAYIRLAHYVTQAYGSFEGIQSQRGTSLIRYYIVGYESDVDAVITLIDSLALQSITASARYMEQYRGSWIGQNEKFKIKRSFIVGFGRGAGERIHSTRRTVVKEVEVESPGTALALVDRNVLVKAEFNALYPTVHKARGFQVGSGYASGRDAGRNARTGETEVGTRKSLGARA
jgi:hypothetical protein